MEAKGIVFIIIITAISGSEPSKGERWGQPRHFQYSINSFRSKGAHLVDCTSHLINDSLVASKNLSPVQRVSLTYSYFQEYPTKYSS